VRPYFGDWRAAAVSTADVRKYIARRQEEGAANATINHELAALRRAFSLGIEAGKVTHRPVIKKLEENNVRTGFFEREQFESVRAHLPWPLQGVVGFAYVTGWRVPSEILPREWRQVDFQAGTVRLEPGTTKNREGRAFPFTDELRALLEARRECTDKVQKARGCIIPYVFHREGQPIHNFRYVWKKACRLAGVPGRIPHDFRRTAVRNLERAGVARSAAMKLTGHKTETVYRRYAIVAENDLREAARKLDEAAKKSTGTITDTAGRFATEKSVVGVAK
jgi:integrase